MLLLLITRMPCGGAPSSDRSLAALRSLWGKGCLALLLCLLLLPGGSQGVRPAVAQVVPLVPAAEPTPDLSSELDPEPGAVSRAPRAGVRLSGTLLLHLLSLEAPLGGELQLEYRPGPSGTPQLVARVDNWRLDLPWLQGVFRGEAFLTLHKGRLRAEHFSLHSEAALLHYQGRALQPIPLQLTGRAEKLLAEEAWTVGALALRLGQALVLQGQAASAPDGGFSATLAGEVPAAAALQAWLGGFLPAWLQAAGATGKLGLTCAVKRNGNTGLQLETILQPRGLLLWSREQAGPLSGLARLTATLDPSGAPEAWTLDSSLTLPAGLDFQGLHLALALEGGADAALIRQCLLRFADDTNAPPLQVEGAMQLDAQERVRFRELRLAVGEGGVLQGSALVGPDLLEGNLAGRELQLAGLAALAGRFRAWDPGAWSPKGRADCSLTLGGDWSAPVVKAQLELREVALASPDGELLAEGLQLGLDAELTAARDTGLLLSLRLPRGALLWQTVFLDFTRHPGSLKLDARLEEAGVVQVQSLSAELRGLGSLQGRGQRGVAPQERLDLDLAARDLQLWELFEIGLKEPLGLGAATASGVADLTLKATGPQERLELDGRLAVRDGGLDTGPEGLALQGLRLDLPFTYMLGAQGARQDSATGLELQWGAEVQTAPESPAGQGTFAFARLASPLGEVAGLQRGIWLRPNELGVVGELELPLFGGRVRLDRLRVREPLSESFELRCRAVVEGLQLGEVRAGPLPLQGTLGGELGELRLNREQLSVPGSLGGSLFGGSLRVSNLGASQPLSTRRKLQADIGVEQLDLEQLSRALDLGVVTGRLNLALQDLVVAYNQPVAFRLEARSVPVRGVGQEISLKAVNAIAVMGTGQGLTGAGVSMFASLFQSFSYEALGFTCVLDSDIFNVRGLIRQGGVEYLIKKPPLFGINVINGNPDNRISFSDMQRRLERVLAPGGATISGP